MFVPLQQILVLLIVVIFSAATNTTTASEIKNSTTAHALFPYPTHENFNVQETISQLATKIQTPHEKQEEDFHFDDENGEEKRNLKLKLIHRDKLYFSNYFSNHSKMFEARMKRDVKRVSSLIHRITGGGNGYRVEEFGSDVVSGMDQGSGEYFVRIGVGSPARNQYMVIDSGSDIVWVQCQPCTQCYHQSDPVFDPSLSGSFAGVSCGSSVCDRVENSGCHAGRCKYEVLYGDGSYTRGTIAIETLTFGHNMVKNVAIGCGHSNSGMFTAAAGLLGLGGGSMSLVGQLGGQTGGAFSYCLVSRGTESTGSLEFGRRVLPVGAAWVPLIRNPLAPSFYYIGLTGLGIGDAQVPISEEVFKITELGDGGVVMDTGTAVTRFPAVVYVAFRDAFLAETASLPRAPAISIFDTCYDLNGFVTVRVPTVSFFLMGGQILTLPARNFLIPVNDKGTFCFAFAPSASGLSIIGNIQQEGIQISFDGANGFVGFGPNIC
ncbi:protein ASPARTIC PROTEASE IN GUARD CELL 2-like [Nicotiana tabacum]|uniref:Protein ASPARTIC PROTEASE IN GUARD CELL 2-like n=1 Tax=Nicotiana tabacum TaxID=4097 RepID=A0A1S4DE92_TOBAC|nr:protein ASPARTIC PROTEASE IN GUARD CELL 2 [Nicotiana tomentosiformis]XP_016511775.1 PREDICTED: protein ASPARTIC PROTEASE IN GUARD CELL 2-like [Nicotiana tabacum]